MLSPRSLQNEADNCELEHLISQWEQQRPLREKIDNSLREVNVAFAAQLTRPDGPMYIHTCDILGALLKTERDWDRGLQETVLQALQVACAMHENTVNETASVPPQHMGHYFAANALVSLSKTALDSIITDSDLRLQASDLANRAEKALTRALDELDIAKCFDFDNMPNDPWYVLPDGGADQTCVAPLPSPGLAPTESPLLLKRGSVYDVTVDACLTPRSAKLKEKALAILNDPSCRPMPLGRRHTMPALEMVSNPYPSRSSVGRTPSKAHPRASGGLHAVQEEGE